MSKTLEHLCELFRDVFKIEKRPVPIKVTIKDKKEDKNYKIFLIGWTLLSLIVFLSVNTIVKFDLMGGDQLVVNNSLSSELENQSNRLHLDNITLLQIKEPTGLSEVLWTKNDKHLYDNHLITEGKEFVLNPNIHKFVDVGLCYYEGTSTFCPIGSLEGGILLVDTKEAITQEDFLVIYLNLVNIIQNE